MRDYNYRSKSENGAGIALLAIAAAAVCVDLCTSYRAKKKDLCAFCKIDYANQKRCLDCKLAVCPNCGGSLAALSYESIEIDRGGYFCRDHQVKRIANYAIRRAQYAVAKEKVTVYSKNYAKQPKVQFDKRIETLRSYQNQTEARYELMVIALQHNATVIKDFGFKEGPSVQDENSPKMKSTYIAVGTI